MIEVESLCKTFFNAGGQSAPAVENISFTAKSGEILGLLGPNGAGKTTTLRLLCTVLKPTSGSARVAGFDVVRQSSKVRHAIGFLSANTGVYDRMTPREMVSYYGKLHGISPSDLKERLAKLFGTLQMNDFADLLGSRLSTGMKQKVSIARALIHDPPVLIFDEPTDGLDVFVQRSVLQNIAALRGQGKCILFSTHIMHEVEKLCDRVAIMNKGRILAIGTLEELRARYGEEDLEELFFQLMGS